MLSMSFPMTYIPNSKFTSWMYASIFVIKKFLPCIFFLFSLFGGLSQSLVNATFHHASLLEDALK